MISTNTVGRSLVTGQWHRKYQPPTWPSLPSPWQQCQHLDTQAHEGENVGVSWHECGWDHSFFLWCVDRVVIVQKFCVLLGCPFPGHLAEGADFSWGFVCAAWCFWVVFSPVSSLGHVRQEENPENSPLCCFPGAKVHSSCAVFCLLS